MIDPKFIQVLRLLVPRFESHSIDWAITGSLGMAPQDMPLEVHDIDLQTDAVGARHMERLFLDYVTRPLKLVERERIRSLLGAFLIEGAQVEIIGDIQKRLPDGTWEPPVRVVDFKVWVHAAGMRLPVLSLEHEYEAYLLMGRTERARLILDWIQRRPAAQADAGKSA